MGRRSHRDGRSRHGHATRTDSTRPVAAPRRLEAAEPVAAAVVLEADVVAAEQSASEVTPIGAADRTVRAEAPEGSGLPATRTEQPLLLGAAPEEPPPEETSGGEPPAGDAQGPRSTATASQLRRFIKSRPYIPLHELRRRFAINGAEDDVIPLDVDGRRLFVGLPPREGGLLAELVRQGEVGYELSLDPATPIIVGVFPMRPVPRA